VAELMEPTRGAQLASLRQDLQIRREQTEATLRETLRQVADTMQRNVESRQRLRVTILESQRQRDDRAPRARPVDDVETLRHTAERLAQLVDGLAVEVVSGPPAAPGPRPTLTRRQLEVLGLLAEGLGTPDIARRLWLSRCTVRNHVTAILGALDAHSRLEAVARARGLGLI
jgi:DNA-binding NarL/FixJ family response regulator